MSTPEQQLEAAKVLLADAAEYLEERNGEAASELRERITLFIDEAQ